MVMRNLSDIEDHSGLTFILIDLIHDSYEPIVQEVESNRGVVIFAPVDYAGAQILTGSFLWAAFGVEDLIMFTLKHAADIRTRITYAELCEARTLITGMTDEINYPGRLTSLYSTTNGIHSVNLVFAIEEAAAWPQKIK